MKYLKNVILKLDSDNIEQPLSCSRRGFLVKTGKVSVAAMTLAGIMKMGTGFAFAKEKGTAGKDAPADMPSKGNDNKSKSNSSRNEAAGSTNKSESSAVNTQNETAGPTTK